MKKENLIDYLESFDPQHLFSVVQFLEWFECCEDLSAPIQAFLDTKGKELARIKRRARQQFDREGMPLVTDDEAVAYRKAPCIEKTDPDDPLDDHWRKEPQFAEPPRLPVVGFCPKCTSTMEGTILPNCEAETTGRHFYSECTACTYYSEIFKGRKGRYIEIKGE